MKKELQFTEVLPYSIDQVWSVIKQPLEVVCEPNVPVETVNETVWVEHCEDNVTNNSLAHIYEDEHKVVVETVNSKYASETNTLEMTLKQMEDQCELHIDYTVGTTPLFNIITMKELGDKLMHHASNVVVKNIKRKLEG